MYVWGDGRSRQTSIIPFLYSFTIQQNESWQIDVKTLIDVSITPQRLVVFSLIPVSADKFSSGLLNLSEQATVNLAD